MPPAARGAAPAGKRAGPGVASWDGTWAEIVPRNPMTSRVIVVAEALARLPDGTRLATSLTGERSSTTSSSQRRVESLMGPKKIRRLSNGGHPPSDDPGVEAMASAWVTEIRVFITSVVERAGTQAGTYHANRQFYDDMQMSITGCLWRTGPFRDQKVVEILHLLSQDIENLRRLHESAGTAGLSRTVGDLARHALETELRALDKLTSRHEDGVRPILH